MTPGEDARLGPVFVCGLGRSGTTWITRSLAQSAELVDVSEAWMLSPLNDLVAHHEKLLSGWTSFAQWGRLGVDRAAFVRHVAGFYDGLLRDLAGGMRFIEKTPEWNAVHLRLLHEMFPDAYFVAIYRDGRNVLASLEERFAKKGRAFDFDKHCRAWARAMTVLADEQTRGEISNLHVVRYEDLVADFPSVFDAVRRFTRVSPFDVELRAPNSAFADCRSRCRVGSCETSARLFEYCFVQLLYANVAAVCFDDSFGNRHAKSGAFGFCGKEGLEDPLSRLLGNTRTVVPHGDLQRRLAVDFGLHTADNDHAVMIAGCHGVLEDVTKNPPELKWIDLTAMIPVLSFFAELNAVFLSRGLQLCPCIAPHLRKIAHLWFKMNGGSVAAHLLVQTVQVVLCLLRTLDQVLGFRQMLDLHGQHFQARLAALQGISAFVGQSGDHLADGCQAGRLHELLFHALALSQFLACVSVEVF